MASDSVDDRGLAGPAIVVRGESRTDTYRLRVRGDTRFDDACLTSALHSQYATVIAGRGGERPYYLVYASVPPPSAPSELARIYVDADEGTLDLSADWFPMKGPAPAFDDALARDVESLIKHAAHGCGVQRWSTECQRPAPHAPCPQLSSH